MKLRLTIGLGARIYHTGNNIISSFRSPTSLTSADFKLCNRSTERCQPFCPLSGFDPENRVKIRQSEWAQERPQTVGLGETQHVQNVNAADFNAYAFVEKENFPGLLYLPAPFGRNSNDNLGRPNRTSHLGEN